MESVKLPSLGRNFSYFSCITAIAYILIFYSFGVKIGPSVVVFAAIPVLLIGWTFGLRFGLMAGLICLPVNTLLYNLIGIPGWDVVFRTGGIPETVMLVFLGGAAGRAHVLTGLLAQQNSSYRSARQALQTSEENYRNLFNEIPIGIYRTTPDGQILVANSALVDLLGYSDTQDLLSHNIFQVLQDPQDRKLWQETIELSGVVRGYEIRIRRQDGTILWTEDNARLVRDFSGNCLYYEGSLLDITERKKAVASLRESEAKYRDLLDNLPQKVFYKNIDLVYSKVNPSYALDLNRSPEEIAGKTDFDLYPASLAKKYQSDDRQVLADAISIELDEDYVQNGDLRTIHTVKLPVRDNKGEITGILGIFWDITDRKQAERALITSQAQLSNAARIAHLGPWEYDVVTDRFTFNDYYYSVFRTTSEREGGYSMSSDQYALRFVYPEDRAVVGEEIRKALETTDPHYSRELEHRIVYADGEMGYINVIFFIVKDEQGSTVKAFGANQDITERKRVEATRESLLTENRRQKDLLERIIQETPAGIAFLEGPNYRYTLVNPGYLEIAHGKGEVLGRTVEEVWPEAIDDLRPLLDHVYQTGENFHAVDMPLTVTREGRLDTAYFTFTYTSLNDRNGNADSLLVTAQETTGQITIRKQLEKELSERKRVEAELRESEQRYCGIFEDSPISLWEEDFSDVKTIIEALKRDGISNLSSYMDEHPETVANCLSQVRVIDVNQEALSMYRAENKADLLMNFEKIFPQESNSIFREELLAIARNQRVFESEGRNCTLTGKTIDIHLRWSVAPGYEDSLSRVFVSILDVSDRKKAEDRAQKQTAQTEALAGVGNALSAASLDSDAIYQIITAQTASLIGDACLLTLISDHQGWMEVAAFQHPNPERFSRMRELFPPGPFLLEDGVVSQILTTGKSIIVPTLQKDQLDQVHEPGYQVYLDHFDVDSLLIVPLMALGKVIGTLGILRDQPGAAYTLEDLSLLRYLANQASLPILNARLYARIKEQAHTDPLTEVPNRRYFFDLAELEFQRADRYQHELAVIMLDVDNFKNINDTYGHDVGDQMLQHVARVCRATIRGTDLIGRYGGDEFFILLPETNLSAACLIAERLRNTIGECPVDFRSVPVPVTVSLGVAPKNQTTPNLNLLLRLADEAMYLSKRSGRNQVRTSEMIATNISG
jgi:diguanylate cyclase (GGDEF)-like protein/PAS domain S-box-containing protein